MKDVTRNMMEEPRIPMDFFDARGRHYTTCKEGESLKAGRPAWLQGRFVVCMRDRYVKPGIDYEFSRFVMCVSGIGCPVARFDTASNDRPTIFKTKASARELLRLVMGQFEGWANVTLDRDDPFRSTYWDGGEYNLFRLCDAYSYKLENLRDVRTRFQGEKKPAVRKEVRKCASSVEVRRDIDPVRYVLQDTVTGRFVQIPPSGVLDSRLVEKVEESTYFDSMDVLLGVCRTLDNSFFNPEFSGWRLKSVGIHMRGGEFLRMADIPCCMQDAETVKEEA